MIVCCASCQSRFRIDPAKVPPQGARIRCPKCKGVISVSPSLAPAAPAPAPERPAAGEGDPAVRVVVAHGSAAFCQTLAGFLRREGFAVEVASEGSAALARIREFRPEVVLADVALRGMIGHTLCDEIRADPTIAHARVILIGAIYDRTRYRRAPQSLYGADDYVEKHRIPDDLLPKIRQLLAGEPGTRPEPGQPPDAARHPAGEPSWPVDRPARPGPDPAVSRAPAPRPRPAAAASGPGDEQARRLARIIVSDIVLYNPEAVQRGLKEGNLAELVQNELREGRELLRARVGAAAAGARDYVLEALDDHVRRLAGARKAAGSPR